MSLLGNNKALAIVSDLSIAIPVIIRKTGSDWLFLAGLLLCVILNYIDGSVNGK